MGDVAEGYFCAIDFKSDGAARTSLKTPPARSGHVSVLEHSIILASPVSQPKPELEQD